MYKTLQLLTFSPATSFFLLAVLIILMWWKRAAKRRWLICLTLAMMFFYVGSTRIVTRLFIGSLEWSYPRQQTTPDHGDVIVVLGGGCRYYGADSHPSYVMNEHSMKRALHAARVYHKVGGCPVIFSGYDSRNRDDPDSPPAADRLAVSPVGQFLIELGVDRNDIILEEESRTTYENASYAKKLIEEQGFKDIVLVTDAAHMRRSTLCFEKLGLQVTPAPCNYYAQAFEFTPYTLLPSDEGVRQARSATREYLGLLWYWLHGRV